MAWPGGDPGQIPAVEEGRAAVQDEGSQLVALALALGADTLVSEPDHHWLDLCSGPGGKTALLAGASITHDAEVMAVELQEHRTRLVERSVATLVEAGAEVETLTADGREIPGAVLARACRRSVLGPRCSSSPTRVSLAEEAGRPRRPRASAA